MTHKILIVGHPESGLEAVESLLQACGMAPARHSRREGLTPVQTDDLLLQAHARQGLGQIQVGPVWQGLALDLLLANLDQPLWGWADPQAVHLLDYWCSIVPDLRVVLVYDRPDGVLTRLSATDALALTPEGVVELLEGWAAYQEAALHFSYRHRDRCLLVHADRVRRDRLGLEESLHRIAPAAWAVPADWHAPEPTSDSAIAAWLAQTPVSAAMRATALYEELQSVADMPATDATAVQWLPAWRACAERAIELNRLYEELARQSAARESLEIAALEREHRVQVELNQLRANQQAQDAEVVAQHQLDTVALKQQAMLREQALQAEVLHWQAAYRQQCESSRAQIAALQVRLDQTVADHEAQYREQACTAQLQFDQARDEAATLLAQLHRVQESYEAAHLAHQRDAAALAQTLDKLRNAEVLAQSSRAERDTLQQQSQALTSQLAKVKQDAARGVSERQAHAGREAAQRAELEAAVRQVEQENALLLSQLHRVQESLERMHAESRAKPTAPKPPVPYGAADRIKQQLSYRLGAKMIEQSGSLVGWMSLPWALKRVHADYQNDIAERRHHKLPPLHTYGDVHEAERVKQHLSYRLGHTLIKHGQSPLGWFVLPVALGREVQTFRRAREQVVA